MARKLFKRILPNPDWVKKQKSLKLLGGWLHDPHIWHLTRHSASSAAFLGLFLAFLPLPIQMIVALVLAVWIRANLTITILLVWITNPLTMVPLYFFAYQVGNVVLDAPSEPFTFELSWHWLTHGLLRIWQPFLLGCLLCGLFFGLLGSTFVRIMWRQHTLRRWHRRRMQREARK